VKKTDKELYLELVEKAKKINNEMSDQFTVRLRVEKNIQGEAEKVMMGLIPSVLGILNYDYELGDKAPYVGDKDFRVFSDEEGVFKFKKYRCQKWLPMDIEYTTKLFKVAFPDKDWEWMFDQTRKVVDMIGDLKYEYKAESYGHWETGPMATTYFHFEFDRPWRGTIHHEDYLDENIPEVKKRLEKLKKEWTDYYSIPRAKRLEMFMKQLTDCGLGPYLVQVGL